MKYLIGLSTLALLLTSGCNASPKETPHNVVCYRETNDGKLPFLVYSGVSKDSVCIVHKDGFTYLAFEDRQNNHVVMDLAELACGIN